MMLVLGSLVYKKRRYAKIILFLAMYAGKTITVTILIVKIATDI